MFEIGALYRVRMRDQGSEDEEGRITEYWNCRVVEKSANLVKFDRSGDEWIVNTNSPDFISAERTS